jgi:thiamine-monophosphate kinase
MDSESQIINIILNNFKKSSIHKNNFFESDAEIIELGSKNYLLTVDSFSDEDYFRTDNPYNLGINLAVGTISDILACGGKPLFFSNSISKPVNWDSDYINLLSSGIAHILVKCNAAFVGGDLGTSDKWNYTGVCIGHSERIVTRRGALPGDSIYITGNIGDGNFEAASQLFSGMVSMIDFSNEYRVKFPLRYEESELVSKYASSSIDTSDGLFRSLSIISEINETGFQISDIPYSAAGNKLTDYLHLPHELLMFGECGEYELMFTVPQKVESAFLDEIRQKNLKITKIGIITQDRNRILVKGNTTVDFSDYNLSARDFSSHLIYLSELKNYIQLKVESLKV